MIAPLLIACSSLAAEPEVLRALKDSLPEAPLKRPAFAGDRPARMTVVDAEGLDLDHKITLLALQGLVNRAAPRLFIVGMHEFNRKADLFWVKRLESRYGIKPVDVDFPAALARYGPELKGTIIYRPEEPQTENVACMVGSLLRLLPVAPAVRQEAAKVAGLRARFDLQGCFADRLAASRWALDHLFSALAPRDVACLPGRTWLLVRDYAVMRGAFMCDLSTAWNAPEESALKGEILDRLPADSIQWGWVCRDNEGQYVAHGSKHGVRTLRRE